MQPADDLPLLEFALREERDERARAAEAARLEIAALRRELASARDHVAQLESAAFRLRADALTGVNGAAQEPDDARTAGLERQIEHLSRELQLQKTMLAALQGEREEYSAYLEALEAAGTSSTRLAVARAARMVTAALWRRLAVLGRIFRLRTSRTPR